MNQLPLRQSGIQRREPDVDLTVTGFCFIGSVFTNEARRALRVEHPHRYIIVNDFPEMTVESRSPVSERESHEGQGQREGRISIEPYF